MVRFHKDGSWWLVAAVFWFFVIISCGCTQDAIRACAAACATPGNQMDHAAGCYCRQPAQDGGAL